jgi:alpha-L-glutamate ligase-like protein
MRWLWRTARRLRELGVLGMNRRNAAFILDHNPRSRFPIVDDKLQLHHLCRKAGVPTPAIYAAVERYAELRRLPELLAGCDEFVIKPNHGAAGRGVLVVVGRDGRHFLRHNGERLRADTLRQHVSDILSGMYSLGGRPDTALVQQRVLLHPVFAAVCFKGIPDIRVILYKKEPAMAMLRLPTRESGGRANLHQGGIGTGIDIDTGMTHHAVQHNRCVERHPDTGEPVVGLVVPHWPEVLRMSRQVAAIVGLGYVGVDIVIGPTEGPMLLEANARPGLAIQIANGRGLLEPLEAIDGLADRPALSRPPMILRYSPRVHERNQETR